MHRATDESGASSDQDEPPVDFYEGTMPTSLGY